MKKIILKQAYQFLAALALAGLVWIGARGQDLAGGWLGISTNAWLALAVIFPVLHQFYVAVCWRAELYHGWLTRVLGERAFSAYAAGFMALFLARPLTVLALGLSDQGSFPVPLWLNISLLSIFLVILAYLAYSFVRYFGARRALGEDHFAPEVYREQPFIRKGIFAWSSNAMYTYGFLALWAIGLAFQSRTAFLAAAFNHLFIWAHFFFTEGPDMREIYGKE